MKAREIFCKSALSKCGFPGGGFCINPYVGCTHGCRYCYARFIRRFTNHNEEWGDFVDARINIAEVLKKQAKSPKYQSGRIFIGTVTDPYQPLEAKYQLTRKVLEVLVERQNPVSILTKSDMVLRDSDILKRFKQIDVNFTISTLDEEWKKLVEPYSPTIEARLRAAEALIDGGIAVFIMMGPYWPFFTDPEALFKRFKKIGVVRVFSESLNTIGGNWVGVEKVLKLYFPELLPKMWQIMFDKRKFEEFYDQAEEKVRELSRKYQIPVTIYFRRGH